MAKKVKIDAENAENAETESSKKRAKKSKNMVALGDIPSEGWALIEKVAAENCRTRTAQIKFYVLQGIKSDEKRLSGTP
jgi:hypothetical protein